MTDLECFGKAIQDFKEMKKLIKGKSFQDVVDEFRQNHKYDITNLCDEYLDINWSYSCLTILNKKGRATLSTSIEVWNDSENNCLGNYTIKEIKEIIKKGGKH